MRGDAPGVEFVRRFRVRLGQEVDGAAETQEAPEELSLIAADGAAAEARTVVERVRALLDSGVRPERIGIVARRLDPYRSGD